MRQLRRYAFLTVLLGIAPGLACGQEQTARRGKVGEAVHQALAASGEALVVVSLAQPRARQREYFDPRALRDQVARVQDEVLAEVGEGGFRVIYRYEFVSGLFGVVTQDGLAALESHPSVRAVDLDFEISAALAESVPHIGADTWHQQGVTGEGVVIAVLDSGLETDHPDLADDLVGESCFRGAALAASAASSGRAQHHEALTITAR